MNKRIEFVKMLVDDIAEEQEYIKEHKAKEKEFEDKYKELNFGNADRPPQYWKDKQALWDMRTPSKTKIKDDVKMIRRLVLEIVKEEI